MLLQSESHHCSHDLQCVLITLSKVRPFVPYQVRVTHISITVRVMIFPCAVVSLIVLGEMRVRLIFNLKDT